MANHLNDVHHTNAGEKVAVDALEEDYYKAKKALLSSSKYLLTSSVPDATLVVDALEETFCKAKEALLTGQKDLIASSALAVTLANQLRSEQDQYIRDSSAEGRAEYLAVYNSFHDF